MGWGTLGVDLEIGGLVREIGIKARMLVKNKVDAVVKAVKRGSGQGWPVWIKERVRTGRFMLNAEMISLKAWSLFNSTPTYGIYF